MDATLANGKWEHLEGDIETWTEEYFSDYLRIVDDEYKDNFVCIDLGSDKILRASIIQHKEEYGENKWQDQFLLSSSEKSRGINVILSFRITKHSKGYKFYVSINHLTRPQKNITSIYQSDPDILDDLIRFETWLEEKINTDVKQKLLKFMGISEVELPIEDKDKDGIIDSIDDCPNTKNYIPNKHTLVKGCLDSDNDGVPDKEDLCLHEKGDTESCGCSNDNSLFKYHEKEISKCFKTSSVSCITYHKGLIYAGSEGGTVFILDQNQEGKLVKPKNIREKHTRFYGMKSSVSQIEIKDKKLIVESQDFKKSFKINKKVINRGDITEDREEYKIELTQSYHNNEYLVSQKKDTLAVMNRNGKLYLDFAKCISPIKFSDIEVSRLFFITDKNLLFIQYLDNTLDIYKKHSNISKWQKIELKWKEYKRKSTSIEVSPDGEHLYLGHTEGLITLFKLQK